MKKSYRAGVAGVVLAVAAVGTTTWTSGVQASTETVASSVPATVESTDTQPAGTQPADSEATSGSVESLGTLKIGYLPVTGAISLFAAIEQGFYDEHGVTVEPVEVAAPALVPGLVSGEFDIVYTGVPPAMLSRANGLPVVAVAPAADLQRTTADCILQVMVPPGSDIVTPEDLVGRRLAVDALFQLPHLALIHSLGSLGVDAGDVDITEIPFPAQLDAAQAGDVDAALLTEPFLTFAKNAGFTTITSICEGWPENPSAALWITTDDFADENPELVAAFATASIEGSDWAIANPDGVRALIPTFTPVDADLASLILLPTAGTEFSRETFEIYAQILLEADILDGEPDIDAVLRIAS